MQGVLDVDNPEIFEGSAAYVRYGFAVANAGDLSGDGHQGMYTCICTYTSSYGGRTIALNVNS